MGGAHARRSGTRLPHAAVLAAQQGVGQTPGAEPRYEEDEKGLEDHAAQINVPVEWDRIASEDGIGEGEENREDAQEGSGQEPPSHHRPSLSARSEAADDPRRQQRR